MSQSFPLSGLTALITGVSRRRGIGFAIAQKLASMGANIVIQHYVPHDMHQPWGADSLDALLEELEQSLNLQADVPEKRFHSKDHILSLAARLSG